MMKGTSGKMQHLNYVRPSAMPRPQKANSKNGYNVLSAQIEFERHFRILTSPNVKNAW